MSDENITTTEGAGLPAVLGGEPVRAAGSFRTTPERDQLEVRYLTEWVLGATNWEPDAPDGGVEVDASIALDERIADALGWEPAAFAAEFLRLQAPGQRGLTCVPNNNGTRIITAAFAALTQWWRELGVREPRVGSEVIVPVATWQATAGALLSRNLVPVLVDVDPETLTISPAAVAAAITERTIGVIPVHLYGRMADVPAIMEIAGQHDLFVLEDCAHAHGARYADGRAAGTVGHAGTFSMQGSKVLSGGEGGAFITRHRELALQVASAVTCGRELEGTRLLQSDNDRMAGIVAALLRAQLTRFPEQNESRLRVFAELDALAARLPGVTALPRQSFVGIQPTYKQLFRFDLAHFGGMSQAQLRTALEAELLCEAATIYEPLTDSRLYTPLTDVANEIGDEYVAAIDPSRYSSKYADEAYREVLAFEHAVGLDDRFGSAFVRAVRKLQAHGERVAAELTV
jgi:dTDP-4-amino-4,6-dideoxygalactose transaminase